jgi:ATP-binding cassette subfamily C protein CydC
MTRHYGLGALSLCASLAEAMAGLLLLALSLWFISACAVAGAAPSAVSFNYLVPAALIRLFAIVRISTGYAEKYLGHLLLLQRLAALRRRILREVLAARVGPAHARATAMLQQATEDRAAKFTAVDTPQYSGAILLSGLVIALALLQPVMLKASLLLVALLLLSRGLLLATAKRLIGRRDESASALDAALERWLGSSPLWSLRADWRDGGETRHRAAVYAARRREVESLHDHGEILLLVVGLAGALVLFLVGEDQPPTPVAAVPVLLFASLRDWLRPALAAGIRARETEYSALLLPPRTQDITPPLAPMPGPIDEPGKLRLSFKDVRWIRDNRAGPAISGAIDGPGLFLFTAPSGIGKTSLLLALCGELEFAGTAMLNGRNLQELPLTQRRATLYLAEQFSRVLSDSLEHNLRLAAPDADQAALVEALKWSELEHLVEDPGLRQWIGEQGRPLSGGERKRLSLARAYLSNAPIWLLDEPFAGMDAELAQHLAKKLTVVANDRLVLVVSHDTPAALRGHTVITFQDFGAHRGGDSRTAQPTAPGTGSAGHVG